MNILIRNMTVEDVPQVIDLGKGQKEFTFEHQSFWLEDQLINWSQSADDICLVAEHDGVIVGFTLFGVHLPTKKVTWENLYVSPEMRKAGVGTKLIEEGVKQVKQKGYKYIMGCVNASDKEGFADYVEKFGFKKGHEMIWIDMVID